MTVRFIKPTSLKSTPNSIQIGKKLCEIICAELFAFSHSCDLSLKFLHSRTPVALNNLC